MTDEQKFLFDVKGWLLLPAVLNADEIQAVKAHLLAGGNGFTGPAQELLDHPAVADRARGRDCAAVGGCEVQAEGHGVVGRVDGGDTAVHLGHGAVRRVAAFETKVIACDPYVDDRRFKELGVERVTLEALAERADYVSVHTLLNAETRHLIGEAFFRRMKPTAILVNTSRGPVVDEQALARALQEKRLAGAALDVWETEPIGSDNPLLKMDNVIATPHAAYFSSAAVAQVPRRCGEEVARVVGAKPKDAIMRDLEKVPADRFATVAQFKEALLGQGVTSTYVRRTRAHTRQTTAREMEAAPVSRRRLVRPAQSCPLLPQGRLDLRAWRGTPPRSTTCSPPCRLQCRHLRPRSE